MIPVIFLAFLSWNLNIVDSEFCAEESSVVPESNVSNGKSNEFSVANLMDTLRENETAAFVFAKNNAKNMSVFSNGIYPIQQTFLQIFYGLSSEDKLYTQLVCWRARIIPVEEIYSMEPWVTENFNFSIDTIENAIVNYEKWKNNGVCSSPIDWTILLENLVEYYTKENETKSSKCNEAWTVASISLSKETSDDTGEVKLKDKKSRSLVEEKQQHLEEEKLPLDARSELKGDMNNRGYVEASIRGDLNTITSFLVKFDIMKSGDNLLHWASANNNLQVVRELLSKNVFVQSKNVEGMTPLHLASKNGHFVVVMELISGNAIVNEKNNEGCTALHLAARHGHIQVVRELLNAYAEVDSLNNAKETPLHWATRPGHLVVVKELLDRNAFPDSQNTYGNTPLNWAAWGGKLQIVRLLLDRNASIELRTYDEGWTSFHRAAEKGQLAVIKEFVARNSSLLFDRDKRNRTPFIVAKEYGHKNTSDYLQSVMDLSQTNKIINTVKECSLNKNNNNQTNCILFQIKIKPDYISEINKFTKFNLRNTTALVQATMTENLGTMKMYLSNYDCKNVKNIAGDSPLHWASKEDYAPLVKELTTKMSMIDTKNDEGWTALHVAARKGHILSVKELLDANADVDSLNNAKETPLHWAAWEGHLAVVKELLDSNAFVDSQNAYGNTPLNWAAWGGKLSVVKLLLDRNARIDKRTYDEGWTALHRAAEKGQLAVIKEFLSRDFSMIYDRDFKNRTSYIVAKERGHKDVAAYLLSEMLSDESNSHTSKPKEVENYLKKKCILLQITIGPNHVSKINEYTEFNLGNDSSLLWGAIEENDDKLKVYLSNFDCNFVGKNKKGDGVLHWASREGYLPIVKELLSRKVPVNSKNKDGWTSLHLSAKSGHLDVVKELLNNYANVDSNNNPNETPLHWAAWEGHLDVVRELLNRNAEIDSPNIYGNTPLSWAAWGGKLDVVKLLLDRNAKIEIKNYHEGWTSLHRAAEQGQLAVVKEFISRNPKLALIKDNTFRTPSKVARDNGHKDIEEYLESVMKTLEK